MSDPDELERLRAENDKLRREIAENLKAFDIGEHLRLSVRQMELQERRLRRKDNYRLPSNVYETLEDLGKLEACIDSVRRLWNKDDDHFRKALLHLSQLSWNLRTKLLDIL